MKCNECSQIGHLWIVCQEVRQIMRNRQTQNSHAQNRTRDPRRIDPKQKFYEQTRRPALHAIQAEDQITRTIPLEHPPETLQRKDYEEEEEEEFSNLLYPDFNRARVGSATFSHLGIKLRLGPRPIRRCRIGSKRYVVLMDTGASNDFISEEVARSLDAPLIPSYTKIALGNKNEIASGFKISVGIHLDEEENETMINPFVLPGLAYDIVIGCETLAARKTVITFKNETETPTIELNYMNQNTINPIITYAQNENQQTPTWY